MTLDPLIMDARRFAKLAHARQQRKYTGQPYFVHVDRVGTRLHKLGHPAHVAAAGFCHDTIEDCKVTFDQLCRALGDAVAMLVHQLTNPSKRFPKMQRAEKKRMDREHIANCSRIVRTIKLVDRIDNVRDMSLAPKETQLQYAGETRLLLKMLQGTDARLELELDQGLCEVEARCGIFRRSVPFSPMLAYPKRYQE